MVERKQVRCAIYTRKSTEYGLEQDFNSLDAQRESCDAYIKSQAHEGWKLLPAFYDDGGISGATLDRPALQSLLDQVKARKIDTIVVYKVDRLTRSLADFAKLVELFDAHGVSFVSVTQQFNTTTSMGRLTLNVLLSFAQFEREVTAERIRDKVAASKQKGIWVGGPVPLGYVAKDKKLVIHDEEAKRVRLIFRRYLELGSLALLKGDLDARGVVTKLRTNTDGRTVGGIPFYLGPLGNMLKNRLYVGDMTHKDKVYVGQQPSIVDRELFDAVQAKLKEGNVARQRQRLASNAILMGRIFDDAGNRMTPTASHKGAIRYRFYLSAPWKGKTAKDGASIHRVSAPELEAIVVSAIRQRRPDAAKADNELIADHVRKIIISRDQVVIDLVIPDGENAETIELSRQFAKRKPRREIVASGEKIDDPSIGLRSERHRTLVLAIGNAKRWSNDLLRGCVDDIAALAKREHCTERYIRSVLPLASLSPEIVSAAIANRLPPHLTVSAIRSGLPMSWKTQRAIFPH